MQFLFVLFFFVLTQISFAQIEKKSPIFKYPQDTTDTQVYFFKKGEKISSVKIEFSDSLYSAYNKDITFFVYANPLDKYFRKGDLFFINIQKNSQKDFNNGFYLESSPKESDYDAHYLTNSTWRVCIASDGVVLGELRFQFRELK